MGRFVQDLARAKNLDAADPLIATRSLESAGIRLPAGLDLAGPLTEGDVTRIVNAAGLRVRTSSPEALFGEWQTERLLVSLGPELGTGGSDPAPRHHDGTQHHHKHKGKGKGKKPKTPTDPYDE